MTNMLQQFTDYLQSVPLLLNSFNSPVRHEEVGFLEEKINKELPSDFKSFLHVYNGQKDMDIPFFDCWFLLSCEQILKNWMIWEELRGDDFFDGQTVIADKEVVSEWWNPSWIPFASDGMGNHLCLDLIPTEYGKKGQIIEVWHDDDKRKLVSSSFSEWIQKIIS